MSISVRSRFELFRIRHLGARSIKDKKLHTDNLLTLRFNKIDLILSYVYYSTGGVMLSFFNSNYAKEL